jgi:PTS system ascorbate-specific IIC component
MMNLNIIFSVVPQLITTFSLGIVGLIGLLLQRKSFSEVISSFIKTILGAIILFIAIDIMESVIIPISIMFGKVYPFEGTPAVDFTRFLSEYGNSIVLVMIFGFLINVFLARITRLKYIFLNWHILFWNAFIVTAALADSGNMKVVPLVIIGSLLLGILSTLLPALIAPSVRELTGSAEFTIGHTTTALAIVGAYLGKWFGNKESSIERIKLPSSFSFFKEGVISLSIITVLMYLILGFAAGLTWSTETFTEGSIGLWLFWSLFQGISFGAGLAILMKGVRMILEEIIPAFQGIAKSLVPNAIPALDASVLFPFAPNAIVLGFPIAVTTSLLTLVVLDLADFKYLLLPMIVGAFFDIGPAAILANATGGIRGTILAAAIGGILIILIQAAALPFVLNSAAGFINISGGNDFGLITIFIGGLAKFFGF